MPIANAAGWVQTPRPNPQADLRLFCFPYAGGRASLYRNWPDELSDRVEVCPIQLPGRGERLTEPPFTHLPHLIDALVPALIPHLDMPFVFFGHSMGGLIAFELTRHLYRQYGLLPERLCISAKRAPHLPASRAPMHQLSPEKFVDALRSLGGTPEAVLENHEMVRMVLPMLRADFTLTETYIYEQDEPLPCPISAFGGDRDILVSPEKLEAWRAQTSADFRLHMFAGGHFYINNQRPALLQALRSDLALS